MKKVGVYHYQNPRQFLLDTLVAKQRENPSFSARAWAKEMELKAPSLLIMLLQGTRPLRLKHVEFLQKGLTLSTPELLYFRAIIQLSNAESDEEKKLCRIWISEINHHSDFKIKEIEEYTVIAQWVHFAIISMTQLKKFSGSPTEIHSYLGGRVSINEIKSALIRLQELNLLSINDQTGRLESTNQVISTKDDVSMKAVREHHRGAIRMAEQALESQSVLEREFQSFSLAIEENKIPLAKELIRRFKQQFTQAIAVKEATADQVYQVNLNFFRLTECPRDVQTSLENEDALMQSGRNLTHSPQYSEIEGNS